MPFIFVVAMGVSGTGKSTLGQALATSLGLEFIDGDSLHSSVNIAKMSAGQPLSDADRLPWLYSIRATASQRFFSAPKDINEQADDPVNKDCEKSSGCQRAITGIVIACSALKKSYRDILRGMDNSTPHTTNLHHHQRSFSTYFVCLEGSRDVLLERLALRTGHFMKPSMLDSQLAAFESPQDEHGVVMVPVEATREQQLQIALNGLKQLIPDL